MYDSYPGIHDIEKINIVIKSKSNKTMRPSSSSSTDDEQCHDNWPVDRIDPSV